MMKQIKIGVVGVGQRGYGMVHTILACNEGLVVAICDRYEDRRENTAAEVEKITGIRPATYENFDEMLCDKNIEAVFISSSWDTHIGFAVKSLYSGKITALEVGGAYDIEACWELVRAYEETKTPFMLMENCCYDAFELLATTLVRRGMLGEIVHCHGAYSHDLREEIIGGRVNRHYRLKEYLYRNCENYPTHELGPIAKLLNINRGNKLVSLVSVASKAAGLEAFSYSENNPDKEQIGAKFTQGDIVNTILTCADGTTITLTLDTTLPKFYSREFTVRGTKGFCMQDANMVMIEGRENMHESYTPSEMFGKYLNSADKYAEFLPDIWQNITDEEREKGHGGMDYLMMKSFLKAALNGEEMPIDVYDAAVWMSVTALSEQSIALGGRTLAVPDFTRGKWLYRKPADVTRLKM